ncbi:MAG: response regulator [Pseudobacteriovorax sp.]|nr:response regulator [Pseudobacteriovorax sp.]
MKKKILVVDDDRDICEILQEQLEAKDYLVHAETKSTKALEQIISKDFDLVISDYKMPEKTGLDLLKEVRENKPQIPFVVITGFPDLFESDSTYQGPTIVIAKPYQFDLLLETIERMT